MAARFWTEEQYEAHQRRVDDWKRKRAAERNGNVERVRLASGGAIEVVDTDSMSGGVEGHAGRRTDERESVADFDRESVTSRSGLCGALRCRQQILGNPVPSEGQGAGIESGPLTKPAAPSNVAKGGASAPSGSPVSSRVAPFAAPIVLPWPPTGNTAVRHANGAHYLRPEVTAYRQTIAAHMGRSVPISGQYALEVELSPPDRRARDIDNVLKSLLDALVKAGWLPGDSMAHMRKLTVTVRPDYTGTVYIRVLTDREAA